MAGFPARNLGASYWEESHLMCWKLVDTARPYDAAGYSYHYQALLHFPEGRHCVVAESWEADLDLMGDRLKLQHRLVHIEGS